jgi:SAM-dependent methyltransferase
MDLRSIRRQWDRLGRRDPLWAVLTDDEKRGGKWDQDGFFRSGEEEVAFVLEHLANLGLRIPLDRALDFGCGVGRLTRALSRRFQRCDGVDIAPSMIERARALNGDAAGCVFHVLGDDGLAAFGDGAFSMVYSSLVLQHVPRAAAERYVREFFRLVAAEGAVVFQLPTPSLRGEAPHDSQRTMVTGPLKRHAFRAHITSPAASLRLRQGEGTNVAVTIENQGRQTWPALGPPDNHFQVKLGSKWMDENGRVTFSDSARTDLPFDLAPGQAATVDHWIEAPAAAGQYTLLLDLVQEEVAWFAERGSGPLRVGCVVEPAPGSADAPVPGTRPLFQGFQAEHHRAHRVLTLLGVVPAYQLLFRVRRQLRRSIERLRRRRRLMDMNTVPTADVKAWIRASGGKLLEVQREDWPGGVTSCRYWCTR